MNEASNLHSEEKKSTTLKEILQSLLDYIVSIIKLPFKVFANFFTREIIKAIKKDIKNYFFIGFLMFCLFIIGTTLWILFAFFLGVYFYEQGNTILRSMGYSIIFQTACLLIITIILYFTSKKLKSIQLIKNVLSLEKNKLK